MTLGSIPVQTARPSTTARVSARMWRSSGTTPSGGSICGSKIGRRCFLKQKGTFRRVWLVKRVTKTSYLRAAQYPSNFRCFAGLQLKSGKADLKTDSQETSQCGVCHLFPLEVNRCRCLRDRHDRFRLSHKRLSPRAHLGGLQLFGLSTIYWIAVDAYSI